MAKGVKWREVRFESEGLIYKLVVMLDSGLVWFCCDIEKRTTACPPFEFSLRCDFIEVGKGDYNGDAIRFYYIGEDGKEPSAETLRLVIEKLPEGCYYVWPVIGRSDSESR